MSTARRRMSVEDIDKQEMRYLMSSSPLDETHIDTATPISTLMVELSACLQMILMDIAQTSQLEESGKRWAERLRSLATFIEFTLGIYTGADEQSQPGEVLTSGARHADIPSSASHTHSNSAPQSSAALTLREFEIMSLSKKGLPPRKIAARLHLSVQTVYTHLRNIRS